MFFIYVIILLIRVSTIFMNARLQSLKEAILCPQAYIHTRMRAKTSDFLKVLNRARPDAEKKEMKTIT